MSTATAPDIVAPDNPLRATRVAYGTALGLVFGVGAYVNLARPGVSTFSSDEPVYVRAGWKYVHGRVAPTVPRVPRADADNFEHPPLAKEIFGLAQRVVGHRSLVADRVTAGICILLTAAVVAFWLARAGQRWAGVVAAGLALCLPQTIYPDTTRFARDGYLDNVAVLFVVLSVVAAWEWAHAAPGRRAWVWGALTGLATGLATAAKENGFLAVLGPGIVLLVVAQRRGQLRGRLAQAAAGGLVAAVTFLATYLPLGHPLARIHYLISFQLHRSDVGTPVAAAGHVYQHPPWWLMFWNADHAIGVRTALLLAALAVAGLVLARHLRIGWWAVAALAGPFVFHSFVAGIVLSFYWVMWMPLFCVLPALGITELARLAWPGRIAATAILAFFGVVAAGVVHAVAVLRPAGPELVPHYLGADARVALVGLARWQIQPYLHEKAVTALPADPARLAGVVFAVHSCRQDIDPGLRALIVVDVADGALRLVHRDRLVLIYRAERPLVTPTAPQVARAARHPLAAYC